MHHNPLNAYDAYGLEGEAYMDSCFVGNFETKISVFSNVDRPDIYSNNQSRSDYISSAFQNASYAVGGSVHGGVNFVTNQMCDLALICCSIGVNEMDDSFEDRRNFNDSFHQSQTEHMNHFDGFVCNNLCDDPNNKIYQSFRSYTTAGLEIGTCAVAGYGIAKGGISAVRMAAMAGRAEKMGGKVAAQRVRCAITKEVTKTEQKSFNAISEKLENYLGNGSRAFHNKGGDLIIESVDGMNQFRIDFYHTSPHKNPHFHLIEYEIKKGRKFELYNERIYPKDVFPE